MNVYVALEKRFPAPEWATFRELRNDAGFKASRSADFVAMNTWPSRGLELHGIEVKTDRRDWLRELKDPAKSAPIQAFCDFWWLATDDSRIAEVDEIPSTWGLIVLAKGGRFVARKPAPKLEAQQLSRGFVAAMLRNAKNGTVPAESINELVEERVKRQAERDRSGEELELARLRRETSELKGRVTEFEQASGIAIDGRYQWPHSLRDPKTLGVAVRRLLEADDTIAHLKLQADGVRKQFADVSATIAGLEAASKAVAP